MAPHSFLEALDSPHTWRAQAGHCYRSTGNNEENNGDAIEGAGRNVRQEQNTEGKASPLHHVEIRADPKDTTLSAGSEERNLD